MAAGLPNITGSSAYSGNDYGLLGTNVEQSGAFNTGTTIRTYSWHSAAGAYAGRDLLFDASLSNSIYGNATSVQPLALIISFCIKY